MSSASTSAALGRDRGRLLEHREEQPIERGGHVGHEAPGTRHLRRGDGVEHRQRRRGFERVSGRRQLVEHHTEREHVAGAGHRLATGLLRRHVARRAEHHAWIGGMGAGRGRPGDGGRRRQPGEPEIEDLHVAVLAQHDVLGLDVAMHDAGGVGHRQGARQLPSEPGQRAGVDGFADQRGQRSAFHELHGQEAAIAQIADGVDRDDVGVIERRRGPRLVLEAPHRVGVAGERGPEQLDRDLAAKLGIVGQVDLTHAAAADERHHVVGADASAQRRGVLLSRQPRRRPRAWPAWRRSHPLSRARRAAIRLPTAGPRRRRRPRSETPGAVRSTAPAPRGTAAPIRSYCSGVIGADSARGRARPGPGSSPAGRCRPTPPARAPSRPGSARRRSAAR